MYHAPVARKVVDLFFATIKKRLVALISSAKIQRLEILYITEGSCNLSGSPRTHAK